MEKATPGTVTLRRNPPRRARATPSSAIPLREPLSPSSLARNIFSSEILHNPSTVDEKNIASSTRDLSENLRVFLRIRPLIVHKNVKSIVEPKNAWPKNARIKGNSRPKMKKSSEICVQVNEDFRSVTVSTPQPLQEMKRIKSEVYEGFSQVFASEVSQSDVYEQMVKPLVEDFLRGKSGMLAAMGPSGSGKTHTVFGTTRDPGIIPLTLRHIFGENGSTGTHKSRVFYLSMFEISSEKGKGERMTDLLQDGGDVSLQQLVVKGLQEAVVSDAQQADSLIANGMLKRATAMTNSNSQSSRSQCIINIRHDSAQDGEVDGNATSGTLTIVDLAGAEREKKTGNQGARLLESNFINNTSMVFGQCLRSLLEHQRNRNKPLPKHYKNSLLTRYLQDYLEGKKRMALILTVKPGVEDYLDTSFLLRQASPFTKIKFKNVEGQVNTTCNKRPNQALTQVLQLKKMKFNNSGVSLIDEGNIIESGSDLNIHKGCSEIDRQVFKGYPNQNVEGICDENYNETKVLSEEFLGLGIQDKSFLKGDGGKSNVIKDREYGILQGLSKALWTVLKQYKEKLEGTEMENCSLKDSLTKEITRNLDLFNEITRQKMRLVDLENELKGFKSRCTCCRKAHADVFSVIMHDASYNVSQYQMADLSETRDSIVTFASCSAESEDHYARCNNQQLEDLVKSSDDIENTKSLEDTSEVDIFSISPGLPVSTNSFQDLIFHEDMCVVDMPPIISQSTSLLATVSPYTSHRPEQDVVNRLGYVKNLEPESKCVSSGSSLATSLDCEESAKSTQHSVDLKDAEQEPAQLENAHPQIALGSFECPWRDNTRYHVDEKLCNNGEREQHEDLVQSSDDTEITKGSKDVCELDNSSRSSQMLSTCTNSSQDFSCHEDMGIQDMPFRSQGTNLSTSGSLFTSDSADQAAINILRHVKNSGTARKCEFNGSSFVTSLDCEESTKNVQDSEDLLDVKQEIDKPEYDDDGQSSVEDRVVPGAAHSQTALKSSEFPQAQADNTCNHVDEEQRNNKESKLEPLVTSLPEVGLDAKNEVKIVPKVVPCNNVQPKEKPKRRLQPASSVLLKDLSLLSINDENDNKLKGGRVGKKGIMDDKNRTLGSLSLLNLLTR